MPVNSPRMGRPPLGVKATTIRVGVETLKRIERIVGPNRFASFVRTAIEEKLERMERDEQ